MAYGVVHFFRRGPRSSTRRRSPPFIQSGQAPRGSDLPRRRPSAGGWTIIAVHDSQESWERFRDDILLPRMHAGIDGGFANPPEETVVDLYSVLPPTAPRPSRK